MRAARALAALKTNRGLVALCGAIFFSMVGSGAITPVLPAFAKDFGVGVLLVALTVALFGVARGVMALPSGFMAQRYGRRPVLVGGMALNTVGSLLMPFSKNITQLILYRTIAGFGSSMYSVGAAIYLRDVATKENRARYQSLNELSILVGVSIGPFWGGALAEAWGIRATLFLQAGLAGVAAIIALAFISETREMAEAKDRGVSSDYIRREMNTRSGLKYLLFNPSFIVVSLFNLMIVANRQGGRFTIMPLWGEKKGFRPREIGLFISLTHLPQFFAVLAAGLLSDRFGRKSTILPASTLILLGILVFVYGSSFQIILLSGLLLGIGEGLAGPPPIAYMADISPVGLEGITMGLYRTIGDIGALTGGLFLGALADAFGFRWSLWTDGMALMAAALVLMVVARETVARRVGGGL